MSCKRLEYLQIGFAQGTTVSFRHENILIDPFPAAAAAYNQTLEPLDKHISKYLDGHPIRIDGKPRASGVLDTVSQAVDYPLFIPDFKSLPPRSEQLSHMVSR